MSASLLAVCVCAGGKNIYPWGYFIVKNTPPMEVAAFDSGRLAENVQEEEWLGASLYIFVGEKMFGGVKL